VRAAGDDEAAKDSLTTISMHRHFAHVYCSSMRTAPLAKFAAKCNLPCVEYVAELVHVKYVRSAVEYMQLTAPGETCDVMLLSGAKRVIDLCLRLDMLDAKALVEARNAIVAFMQGNQPASAVQAVQRSTCRCFMQIQNMRICCMVAVHAGMHVV
jgi:hypothetical protein